MIFSLLEVKVPMVSYIEMGGSNGFLFRKCRFQWFSFWKCVIPMFSYIGIEGSKGSLFRNGWFRWLSV